MLKNSKQFLRLKSEWKKNLRSLLVDVVLFGSLIKGKQDPNDIDICLIFRDKIDLKTVKYIETVLGDNFHISSLVVDNFFNEKHSLAQTILFEGESIISGKSILDTFSLNSKLFYSYDLSNESSSKKVRFVYLLRGRIDNNGLVKKWGGEFLSNNSFMVSTTVDEEVKEVFTKWEVKYKRMKFLLLD